MNLDHHVSNEHFAQWEYFKSDYAATGEILTCLFDQWHITCPRPSPMPLYGHRHGLRLLQVQQHDGHTLRMAAILVDNGAQPDVISDHLDARSLNKLRALSKVLDQLELFADGRISCLSYTPELLSVIGEHTGIYIDYAAASRVLKWPLR